MMMLVSAFAVVLSGLVPGGGVPVGVDSIAKSAAGAITSALSSSGHRALRVDAFDYQHDIGGTPASLCARCMEALASHEQDGPLVMLAPDVQSAADISEAVKHIWPSALRPLEVKALDVVQPSDERPAAVILVDVDLGTAGANDETLRAARAWIRSARTSLCLNAHVPMMAFESAELVYALVPCRICRELLRHDGLGDSDRFLSERIWALPQPETLAWKGKQLGAIGTLGGSDVVSVEPFGRVLLSRSFPGGWHVLLDAGDTGEFTLIAELDERPTWNELTELVIPTVKARRAAVASAMRALMRPSAEKIEGRRFEQADADADGEVASAARGVAGAGNGEAASGANGAEIVTLEWSEVKSSAAALKQYEGTTILRQRAYGGRVSFAKDERGVHLLQPYETEEEAAAARAKSEGYGRLNGDVKGVCVLVPNDRGEGVSSLEQLAVQRDVTPDGRAECAAALLGGAIREAVARGQSAVVVAGLPPQLTVEGTRWLEAAGFDAKEKGLWLWSP
jgi:hypothetical protein